MSVFTVTEEAVKAIADLALQLLDCVKALREETKKLKQVFEDNESGLGYHSASIKTLIEDVEAIGQEAEGPVKKLVLKLRKAAKIRIEHINNNRYGKSR